MHHFDGVKLFTLDNCNTVDIIIGNDNAFSMCAMEERMGESKDESTKKVVTFYVDTICGNSNLECPSGSFNDGFYRFWLFCIASVATLGIDKQSIVPFVIMTS